MRTSAEASRMENSLAGLPCSCCFIRRPETTVSTVPSALTTYPEPLTSASEPPTLFRCCPKCSELDWLEVMRPPIGIAAGAVRLP